MCIYYTISIVGLLFLLWIICTKLQNINLETKLEKENQEYRKTITRTRNVISESSVASLHKVELNRKLTSAVVCLNEESSTARRLGKKYSDRAFKLVEEIIEKVVTELDKKKQNDKTN